MMQQCGPSASPEVRAGLAPTAEPSLPAIDASIAWTPDLVGRMAAFLASNEVACLRLVNKAAENRLAGANIDLSQPLPSPAFRLLLSPAGCRALTTGQRREVVRLAARSNDVTNLELAAAATGIQPGALDFKLEVAAAAAGAMNCCRYLDPSASSWTAARAAGKNGHETVIAWALEACDTDDRFEIAREAALGAAEGGHVALLERVLRQFPPLSAAEAAYEAACAQACADAAALDAASAKAAAAQVAAALAADDPAACQAAAAAAKAIAAAARGTKAAVAAAKAAARAGTVAANAAAAAEVAPAPATATYRAVASADAAALKASEASSRAWAAQDAAGRAARLARDTADRAAAASKVDGGEGTEGGSEEEGEGRVAARKVESGEGEGKGAEGEGASEGAADGVSAQGTNDVSQAVSKAKRVKYKGEQVHVDGPLLRAALSGCDLATVELLCCGLGLEGAVRACWSDEGEIAELLLEAMHAALYSSSHDWQAKAERVLAAGRALDADCFEDGALFAPAFGTARDCCGEELVERYTWLKARGFWADVWENAWEYARDALVEAGRSAAAVRWLLLEEGVEAAHPLGPWDQAQVLRGYAEGGHVTALEVVKQEGWQLNLVTLFEAAANQLAVEEWVCDQLAWPADDHETTGKLLHFACERGHVGPMRRLAGRLRAQGKLGEHWDARASTGRSAWCAVAGSGCVAAAELLAELGCPKPTDGSPYKAVAERLGDQPWWMFPALHGLGVGFGPAEEGLLAKCALVQPGGAWWLHRWDLRWGEQMRGLDWLLAAGCPVADWAELEAKVVAHTSSQYLNPHPEYSEAVLAWVREQRARLGSGQACAAAAAAGSVPADAAAQPSGGSQAAAEEGLSRSLLAEGPTAALAGAVAGATAAAGAGASVADAPTEPSGAEPSQPQQ
ncbi:hypothetical protein HYH03_004653 [Edaphochlamys debaryana]|uniref:Ankyrin repeat domain-containing protein n=1 Tax=Edaphochlamys debaryana TaxID=47281 RepID=A0A836C207_9CHLO|nr:hypothetical protein HYH03_004653 [Edaphochlamys debaryana]|eukprot:KAG2497501.1 hypothetical protein HYH03_004653 [Edaphochlamys debaryana]